MLENKSNLESGNRETCTLILHRWSSVAQPSTAAVVTQKKIQAHKEYMPNMLQDIANTF